MQNYGDKVGTSYDSNFSDHDGIYSPVIKRDLLENLPARIR